MKTNATGDNERDLMFCSKTIEAKYRPDHFFLKASMGFVALAISMAIDVAVLLDFVRANRIPVGFFADGIGGFGIIAGFILVLDVLLPVSFIALKRRHCRSDMAPWALIGGGFLIVAAFVACMLLVRLSLVTPETIARGSRTYPQAYVFALLPIGTSVTSAMLFWMAYNPLLKKMHECEQRIFSESEKLRGIQSELAKYDCDNGDYRSRLVEEEHRRYQQKFQEIKNMAADLKAHFRRRLAETLADPNAATVLSAFDIAPFVERVEMMEIPQFMLRDAGGITGKE